jgi:chemotaxis methyl-accepting protein methylase
MPTPWSQLSDCIAAALGLHFPPQRLDDLSRGFGGAAREFGFDDPLDGIAWLLAQPLDEVKLQVLARHLTVGETYFFRDAPAMQSLANHVLPALVEARRGHGRRLRLWSAACCTGEEAYTLAILLHRLLPDLNEWDVSVLATDLNASALAKAEAATYSDWSFRGVPAWFRSRYFEPQADGRHRVIDEVRGLVRFEQMNLVDLPGRLPHERPPAMDFIACRNVLMYFTSAQAARVVAALRRNLQGDDASLMLGSAEFGCLPRGGFDAVTLDGAVFFRKTAPRPLPRQPQAIAVAAPALHSTSRRSHAGRMPVPTRVGSATRWRGASAGWKPTGSTPRRITCARSCCSSRARWHRHGPRCNGPSIWKTDSCSPILRSAISRPGKDATPRPRGTSGTRSGPCAATATTTCCPARKACAPRSSPTRCMPCLVRRGRHEAQGEGPPQGDRPAKCRRAIDLSVVELRNGCGEGGMRSCDAGAEKAA